MVKTNRVFTCPEIEGDPAYFKAAFWVARPVAPQKGVQVSSCAPTP